VDDHNSIHDDDDGDGGDDDDNNDGDNDDGDDQIQYNKTSTKACLANTHLGCNGCIL
jgi:hypothetical protein